MTQSVPEDVVEAMAKHFAKAGELAWAVRTMRAALTAAASLGYHLTKRGETK